MENTDNQRCCINGCLSSSLNDSIRFFPFPAPQNPDFPKWVSICKDSSHTTEPHRNMVVCEQHFTPEDVDGKNLKPHTFPKLRLGEETKTIQRPPTQEEIDFLNRVIVEWISRNRTHRNITGKVLIDKVQETKDLLEMPNFEPDKSWLHIFNELMTPRSKLDQIIPCGESIHMMDIITELREQGNKLKFLSGGMTSDTNFNKEMTELDKDPLSLTLDEDEKNIKPVELNEPTVRIMSDDQAWEVIKELQEYSMLQENFRAIGLVAHLEQLYKDTLGS